MNKKKKKKRRLIILRKHTSFGQATGLMFRLVSFIAALILWRNNCVCERFWKRQWPQLICIYFFINEQRRIIQNSLTWMTALKKHVFPKLLKPFTETPLLSSGVPYVCDFLIVSFLRFFFLLSLSALSPQSSVFRSTSIELVSSFTSTELQ